MLPDEIIRLSKYRLSKAISCLDDADLLLKAGRFESSSNRSYYAVFHAMRAVLAIDGVEKSKHSGIISEFRLRYIKTGIFDAEISKIIGMLSDARTESDYEDYFSAEEAEYHIQLKDAKYVVSVIEKYLNDKYISA